MIWTAAVCVALPDPPDEPLDEVPEPPETEFDPAPEDPDAPDLPDVPEEEPKDASTGFSSPTHAPRANAEIAARNSFREVRMDTALEILTNTFDAAMLLPFLADRHIPPGARRSKSGSGFA